MAYTYAKIPKTYVTVLAVLAAGVTVISSARADEAQAKSLFKAMSDYLAAQQAISMEYDASLEIVTTQQQKLGLASSGTLTLNRPDKVRATRTGGFADIELDFDGKTVTLIGKNWSTNCDTNTTGPCRRPIC
jgi:hypothetical protein